MSSGIVESSQSEKDPEKNRDRTPAAIPRARMLQRLLQQGSDLPAFIKALIEASTIMRAQKERGLAVLQKHIKTDRALAEIGYKNLLDDLTPYTFTTVKGLRTVQEIVALRDPKIAKYNVEDLLDQRILKKVVESGYVEELERRYKIRS